MEEYPMPKSLNVILFTAIFFFLTVPASKASEIEPVLSYQGFLIDNSGVPLNGAFDMNFMITDSPDTLWQEFHANVPVDNGNFMVVLGETDPIPPDALVNDMDTEQYAIRNLQIQVGADPPMSPVAGDIFTSPGSIKMGIEPIPFNPSVEIQAMSDFSSFTMFDPTAGPDGGAISEMTANVGGQFSWLMFNPQPEPPGIPIMDMNTGPGGEINWVFFNPQPEPPGHAWMDFGTDASGPSLEMTAPGQLGALGADISDPMIQINADSVGPKIALQRSFVSGGGVADSTRIYLAVDSAQSVFDMFGPGSGNDPTIRMINESNGPFVGIGADPTNIITVRRGSSTDPIADAWTTYSSRRWKKNVKPIDNALQKVERLRGVTFDWKADGKHDIGLIAEEVGEVIPEVVAYEENGVDARSVDYARLVSVLIEAVKEQQAEIDDLREKLDKVTTRVMSRERNDDSEYSSFDNQEDNK
jgi:hypothetical protein